MFEHVWTMVIKLSTPLMALEEITFHRVSVSQGMKWPRNCVRLTEIISRSRVSKSLKLLTQGPFFLKLVLMEYSTYAALCPIYVPYRLKQYGIRYFLDLPWLMPSFQGLTVELFICAAQLTQFSPRPCNLRLPSRWSFPIRRASDALFPKGGQDLGQCMRHHTSYIIMLSNTIRIYQDSSR